MAKSKMLPKIKNNCTQGIQNVKGEKILGCTSRTSNGNGAGGGNRNRNRNQSGSGSGSGSQNRNRRRR